MLSHYYSQARLNADNYFSVVLLTSFHCAHSTQVPSGHCKNLTKRYRKLELIWYYQGHCVLILEQSMSLVLVMHSYAHYAHGK